MANTSHNVSNRFERYDLVLLAVAAMFWPLSILGRNIVGMPHPERLIAVGLAVFALSVGLSRSLMAFGLPRGPVVRTTFISVIVLMMGGRIVVAVGVPLGYALAGAIVVLAAIVFSRFGEHPVVNPVVVALAVAVFSGSLLSLYTGISERGSDGVAPSEDLSVALSDKPDIFLIVLDGYPGSKTLATYGEHDNDPALSTLTQMGFQSPASAWSVYWSTALSMPALLDMAYPVGEPFQGTATDQTLYRKIGGDNTLVDVAQANDYEVYMVESGWSGSSCGPRIDKCVTSPIVDEAMTLVLRDNLIGVPLMRRLGSPFTVGSEHAMDWLLENGASLSRDPQPSLVLAHLVIPHPPFYLDRDCSRIVEAQRSGSGLYEGDTPRGERERFFSAQMTCVDRFIVRFAGLVEDNAVVVFTSDHGTARFRQLNFPGEEWREEHISDRLNVFMSVRVTADCDLGKEIILPNLMRRVLACYSESAIADLEPRMFIPPMIEVDSPTVAKLMAGEEGS